MSAPPSPQPDPTPPSAPTPGDVETRALEDAHGSEEGAGTAEDALANTAAAASTAPPATPSPKPAPQPMRGPTRWLLYALAVLFLGLGILGAFLPGLPTTVFILASAWAAARSSPRLHGWLRQHRVFGSILRNWEDGGFVSRKAKIMASVTMLASVAIMLLVRTPLWVTALASFCMACVAIWLWLRPEGPPPSQQP